MPDLLEKTTPDLLEKIAQTDWQAVSDSINDKGYALLPGFLSAAQCQSLIGRFDNTDEYRKTVVMARYRFGQGLYKYWDYPLPELVQTLRENLYPKLVPIANHWMDLLRIDKQFPNRFSELQTACHQCGQQKPTPLILQYGEGGYNTLHQDLYGEVYFPLQAACFLSEPEKDYTGGEFVLTEQVPRAQSKALVLTPKRGDMIVFTTQFRPVKGVRGYYRANMRHGVSEVRSGMRYAVGIIFHDAVS
ncbi:MAG: 2OG-Fe(II) oxygenase [Hahellaceae bacterium]|nr:2OG-Fe(II) oxygenase [Hahellaceae bacterium]MCP5170190.1 2OG-Fe(II) oxygenase [Hahellaceae bacterium]